MCEPPISIANIFFAVFFDAFLGDGETAMGSNIF
jgi:hypothetical protein